MVYEPRDELRVYELIGANEGRRNGGSYRPNFRDCDLRMARSRFDQTWNKIRVFTDSSDHGIEISAEAVMFYALWFKTLID